MASLAGSLVHHMGQGVSVDESNQSQPVETKIRNHFEPDGRAELPFSGFFPGELTDDVLWLKHHDRT